MDINKPKWLDHLEGVVPEKGYGNRMSMYLIALEGWRRGLNIKFYRIDNPENKMYIRYTISDGTNEHKFESSKGDKLTSSAYETCENKGVTKSVLSKRGIPVPEGQSFSPNTDKKIITDYAETIKFPVVVKPIAENAGKGVFPNISTVEELEDTLDHMRQELGYEDILVEKHFYGNEYRILIIDGKIVGAVNRLPANIIGDGKSTVDDLIRKKNNSKIDNPIISTKVIEVDKEVLNSLVSSNYTLESILPKNERIYLRNKSNVSRGGDPIDVTEKLTGEMREIALKSARAIDGLDICGLDMLVNEADNSCVVLEINTKPMIGLHVYPIQGEARDVVSPIIDYYFPNTKQIERSNLYFDLEAALSPIRNHLTNEVNLTPLEGTEKLHAKQFIINGKDLEASFRNKIRLRALKLNLNGFIKEVKSKKKVMVVVATKNIDHFTVFSSFLHELDRKHSINNIEELEWTKPINIGFLISTIPNTTIRIQKLRNGLSEQKQIAKQKENKIKLMVKRGNKLESKINGKNKTIMRLDTENQKLKDELKLLYNKIDYMYNSRSWKLTQPLRSYIAKRNKKKDMKND